MGSVTVPRAIRRAIERGLTDEDIVDRYPVGRRMLHVYREQMGVPDQPRRGPCQVARDAQRAAYLDRVDRAVRRLREGRDVAYVARVMGRSGDTVCAWARMHGLPQYLYQQAPRRRYIARRLRDAGATCRQIAEALGVSSRCIRHMLEGRRPRRQFAPCPGLPQPGEASDSIVAEAHGFGRSTVAAYRRRHSIPAHRK